MSNRERSGRSKTFLEVGLLGIGEKGKRGGCGKMLRSWVDGRGIDGHRILHKNQLCGNNNVFVFEHGEQKASV